MPANDITPFIVDANVIIDYWESDIEILSLLSQKIAPVYISLATIGKVMQISEASAKRNHIVVIIPEMNIVNEAKIPRSSLAYDDRETLLVAKSNSFICITNDKKLRQECKSEGVTCLWGLEPMKILIEAGWLKASEAVSIARRIHSINPFYITDKIIALFEQQIKSSKEKTD